MNCNADMKEPMDSEPAAVEFRALELTSGTQSWPSKS
jgi:hypothetical protein